MILLDEIDLQFIEMTLRHKEGDSTCFGTVCNYTALRLLGVSADHPVMVKARATIHRLGMSIIRGASLRLLIILKVERLASLHGASSGYLF